MRVVPLHHNLRGVLAFHDITAIHIPEILVAGGAEHRIGGGGTLAHRAVTAQFKVLSLQHLDIIHLLVVAAAVVVHAVNDLIVGPDVLYPVVLRRGGAAPHALPVVANNIGIGSGRQLGEFHRCALADIDNFLPATQIDIHRGALHHDMRFLNQADTDGL